MKVALLYPYNARDKRSWSGTAYYIARILEKYCGEVCHLGPLPQFKEVMIGKIIDKCSQVVFKKSFRYEFGILLAKKYARVAAQRLKKQSFDIIVAPLGTPVVAYLKTDIPIVLIDDTTYKLVIDYYPWFSNLSKRSIDEMNIIQTLALKKASALIYSSSWAGRSAIDDYGADPAKTHIISFGANFDENPSQEIALARKTSDCCHLLFLGVDWERKGGDIAFETLLMLEKMNIQATLTVCGCVPPKTVVHKRIKIIPFLEKDDEGQGRELEKLFIQANFLLIPTRADCTPIVFCEASAFGLPVITTDTGGISEIIKNDENGFLLPYDARGAAYAEVIAKIYCDNERYTKLAQTSRSSFEQRLNWDTWGDATRALLTELLHERNVLSLSSLAVYK